MSPSKTNREKLPVDRTGLRRKFKINRPEKFCLKCATPSCGSACPISLRQ